MVAGIVVIPTMIALFWTHAPRKSEKAGNTAITLRKPPARPLALQKSVETTVFDGSFQQAVKAPDATLRATNAQPVVFGNGIPFQPADLPACPLRTELESLPPTTLIFSMARLTKISFHINDLNSLHVDSSGMPYYVCTFSNTVTEAHTRNSPTIAKGEANIPVRETVSADSLSTPAPIPGILAAVPITSPPIRHSKPGSTNILYLDFNGSVVTNTAWNTSRSVARWDCLPFDTDDDTNTFSEIEQGYIIRMWERVAEDYAPFDIDVTTEQPALWTRTTGHALITPSTDANDIPCPHYNAGGIAYIDVFGDSDYSYGAAVSHSPAFVLPMNGDSYADTAEAISHELGHNMGLSHDGTLTVTYYGGHGSGDISWGPIMGTGYGRNVSQWSKGEYFQANQTQDDLDIISQKTPYRTDDHGNTNTTATLLIASNGTLLIASGIISRNTDVDVFSFVAGVGSLSLTVFPYRCATGTHGGNLDISARLYNSSGTLVASNNPPDLTQAIINYTSPASGTYFLHISNSGAGNPTNDPPTGYTSYGSVGQYSVTGSVALATGILVNKPNGGELWYIEQTNTITWSSGTDVGEAVKIDLFRGGNLYNTITNSVTNSGSYSWIIANPMLSSTNFQIKISSITQTSIWDKCDAVFSIAVAPPSIRLSENFDAGKSLPAGWSKTNLSGTTTWKIQTGGGDTGYSNPGAAHSAPYNACLYDATPASDICRLSTPPINLSGCTGAVLRFWHYMKKWEPDQDNLHIWVKTNASASWIWVVGFSDSVSNWTQRTIALPNPGAEYSIGFAGDAKYGHGVCLDDVEVTGYPGEITSVTNNTPLAWLADYGLEPTDTGALSDTDHDGMKAWEEWIAGTIPTQFLSVLKISNSLNTTNGRILLWPTVTGRVYSVSWSTNLLTAPPTLFMTNNTTGIYTDTVHTIEQSGFYRIGVQMGP